MTTMPTATHDHTTLPPAPPVGRRAMLTVVTASLAGTALNVATLPAGAAQNPDAKLIATATRLIELDGEFARLLLLTDVDPDAPRSPELEANEEAEQAASEEQQAAGEWLAETPARTLAGLQAKARAIQTYNAGWPQHDMIGRLTASLVNQLAAGIAA